MSDPYLPPPERPERGYPYGYPAPQPQSGGPGTADLPPKVPVRSAVSTCADRVVRTATAKSPAVAVDIVDTPTASPEESMSTAYTTTPSVLTQELDGETILLDAVSGTYFRLNGTGTQVWAGITAGRTVEDIVTALAAAAAVERERVRADVTALLADLQEKGLVSAGA